MRTSVATYFTGSLSAGSISVQRPVARGGCRINIANTARPVPPGAHGCQATDAIARAFDFSPSLDVSAAAICSALFVGSLMTPLPCVAEGLQTLPAEATVSAVVDVKRGTDVSTLPPAPTLYLTAKPDTYQTPYASVKEELSLAGKPYSFPREFNIGSEASDILVPSEQYELLAGILTGTDVVISARLDSDGDPTTRDSGDLVGRAVAKWDQKCQCHSPASVILEGRGVFGKMVTSRGK